MAFMLPALGGLLGSFLFKKKGGKIIKQTPTGQVFVQPKMNGGAVKTGLFDKALLNMDPKMLQSYMGAPIRRNLGGLDPRPRKKGGKVTRSKPPGAKHQSGSRAGKKK